MLLPYYAQSSNLESCQKWTQDSVLSAADVYAALGSPSVFRLRFLSFYIFKIRTISVHTTRNSHIFHFSRYCWFANPLKEPLPTGAAQRSKMSGEEVQNLT